MFRRGNPFVRAREEASSTCGASHLRAGLSLSWPSHVHIQPNLLKSCQDLWHSSVSLVTKEELSVSTRQTKDNKATKNRSMIVISLQGKGWRSTKILVGNFPGHESVLSKKHNAINYHAVREAVAAGTMRVAKEDGETNLADLLTKSLNLPKRKRLLGCMTY